MTEAETGKGAERSTGVRSSKQRWLRPRLQNAVVHQIRPHALEGTGFLGSR
jgi:hypothetical protein